ncbi:protein ALP1-like [Camponotus floridanus]|uniref:protein ALP1-like n=1 Tax=Camponotus floridanus TaxID=104421 RepID=UPI000DC687A3|nr:protein ALP1-like [Camponotus floridanus]
MAVSGTEYGELKRTDHEEFFSLFRMSPEYFDILVDLVKPYLVKRSIRSPFPTELRLAVTLMYLAQGDSARSKHLEFRLGKSTVHSIINETCRALWFALSPVVLKPVNRFGWELISEEFMANWQFPNCLGAIDGRHMRIQAPRNSGSTFYNYKQFFSIVLLATCDAKYKFTWIDIGQYGSISDGGVWANTDFAQDLQNGAIDLPIPRPLPERNIPFPFVFVADEAFPLTTYLMRPYSRKNSSHFSIDIRIFNYRLSRCRRIIENTFGILTARWQILHKPLCMSLENSEMLFKILVCLHNFVMMGEEELPMHIRRYCPPDYIDREENYVVQEGRWREQHSAYFKHLGRVGANRAGTVAEGLRNYLRDYFISPTGVSQVPWQYEAALGTVRINPPAR